MRWIITNIAGSTIGIAVGTPIALGIYDQISRALHFKDCSGLPCDSRALPTMVLAGIIGGILGGCAGYISFQRINHFPIRPKYLIGYALLGAFAWPINVVLAIICTVLDVMLIPPLNFGQRLGDIIGWGLIITNLVLLPGIAFGLVLALVRRIPVSVVLVRQRLLQR